MIEGEVQAGFQARLLSLCNHHENLVDATITEAILASRSKIIGLLWQLIGKISILERITNMHDLIVSRSIKKEEEKTSWFNNIGLKKY